MLTRSAKLQDLMASIEAELALIQKADPEGKRTSDELTKRAKKSEPQ